MSVLGYSALRARAIRRLLFDSQHLAHLDELDGDVRYSPQLAEVAQSRARAFDGPTQTHLLGLRALCRPSFPLPRNDGVFDSSSGEAGSRDVGVVASVEPQCLDLTEQAALSDVGR